MKLKRSITWLIFIAVMITLFAGCTRYEYVGKHIDLHTIIMNNTLGVATSRVGLWARPMDEDSFGRRMFIYGGHEIAIGICQKSDNKYVYYYPDDCYILYNLTIEQRWSLIEDGELSDSVWDIIPAEDLEMLKEMNDWDKPIDESRCEKKKISRNSSGNFVKDEAMMAFYAVIDYDRSSPEWFQYMTSDDYGRHIYFSRICDSDGNYIDNYAVMFHPDKRFDYIKIIDLFDYREQMKEFKARNNWGEPIN